MPACLRLMLLAPLLLPLPGCATAALNVALRAANPQPAWDGQVALASEPPGAACSVLRGDRELAQLPATPGTVTLPRSHAVLEVRCRAEGHVETVALLRPADDPAVFRMAPNGIIGATATVFSLSTARTMRYAGAVTITMVPAMFADEDARTQFFETRRGAILAQRAAQLALADDRCRAQPDTSCDPAALVLRQAQDDDLAQLEGQRARTRVNAPGVQVAVAGPPR